MMLSSLDERMILAEYILDNDSGWRTKHAGNKDYMDMVRLLQQHNCLTKKTRKLTKQFSATHRSSFEKTSNALIRYLEPDLCKRMEKSDAVGRHSFYHNAPIIRHEHKSDVGMIGWIKWTEYVFEHADEEMLMELETA